jgi:short-subunit dehydrogenase
MSFLDGSTVLLTGASSGIGRQMALLLAARVKSIAIVARRRDKLDELSAEMKQLNPQLTVHVMPCDLAKLDETARLADEVERTVGAVDVLINNAGVAEFTMFDLADWKRTHELIELNVSSLVYLTHRFVRPMVARGRGGILNVASVYGFSVTPAFSVYLATKHFVLGFTESLRLDLHGTGVVVSVACPGPTKTEFASRAYHGQADLVPDLLQQSDRGCARQALRGFERGRAFILTGWVAKALSVLIGISPRFLRRWVMIPFARPFRQRQLAGTAGGTRGMLPGP